MIIDWSKAPADATHFSPVFEDFVDLWAKTDGRTWMYRGMSSDAWHFGPQLGSKERYIERPWSGEGLPPVGTVCEFAGGTHCPEDPFDKDLKEGMPVTIIAHFKSGDFTLAAFTFDPKKPDRGMAQVEQGNFGCFRPIRTAEQIAVDERAAAIEEIRQLLLSGAKGSIESVIYDAGYRKQVQP